VNGCAGAGPRPDCLVPPMAASIAPELANQLDAAETAEPVGAVMRLARAHSASSDQTVLTAQRLLDHVQKQVGVAPVKYNVFKNLGYFVVYAAPAFIRKLAEQPEVDRAQANEQ
jgi:hypothetical protein